MLGTQLPPQHAWGHNRTGNSREDWVKWALQVSRDRALTAVCESYPYRGHVTAALGCMLYRGRWEVERHHPGMADRMFTDRRGSL